jgi:hypothetical protein
MRQSWESEAQNWAHFARTPGLDRAHEDINVPALLDLLPPPGRRTLDLACGEGRPGRLCAAIPHPINSAGSFPGRDPAGPFVISGSYLDPAPGTWVHDRGGVRLTFHSEHRPLEAYMRAMEAAGLLTETIREVRAPDHVVARDSRARRWQRIPLFLHLRAIKPG